MPPIRQSIYLEQFSMDVNLFQAEGSAESDERFRHLRDDVRSFSSGSANARIVKENHLMIRRKIPAVHVGIEVLQKERRNRARFAESAIGEADSVSLYELCRRGLVGMNHCDRFLITVFRHYISHWT